MIAQDSSFIGSCSPGINVYLFRALDRPFPPHLHNSFLLGSVLRGSRIMCIGQKELLLGKGQLLILGPGTPHSCRPPFAGESCTWLAFHTSPAAPGPDPRNHGSAAVIEDAALWQRWLKHGLAAIANPAAADARFLEALIKKASLSPAWAASARANGPMPEQDRAGGASLTGIAPAKAKSRFSQIRQFRASTGITPHRYLQSMRIHRAQNLLSQGLDLCQCALDAGFYDQSHFCRSFKALLGVAPGKWQKACGAGR